MTLAKYNTTKH